LNLTSRPFALLDRDGTLIADRHYLADPDGVELLPGAAEGLRQLRLLGLGLVVVTNQSGVGRGFFTPQQMELVNQRMCALLATADVHLDGIFICPHAPEAGCDCRKPQPGLALAASRALNFFLEEATVIGDRVTDIEMGRRIGAVTFLVGKNADGRGRNDAEPDYRVGSLIEVAAILRSLRRMATSPTAANPADFAVRRGR
jgi:histidinol-phosphate phosphatase family protein